MIALLFGLAFAQEEVCASVYTIEEFREAIAKAEAFIEEGEIKDAMNVLGAARKVVHCMKELVPRDDLVRFADARARASFFSQDPEEAIRWGHFITVLYPDYVWPDGALGVKMLLEEAEDVELVRLEDAGFAVEKKGSVFMDGVFLPVPQAHNEVPHLVQVFNGQGHLVRSFWQDGANFPSDLLGEPVTLKRPRYYDPVARTITPRGKPPEEIPVRKLVPPSLVAGGAMVAVSGVLYGLAGFGHAAFRCNPVERDGCPGSPEELTRIRTRTNLLVVGAGVMAVSGIGIGVVGLLDGTPRAELRLRFR